MAASFRLRVVVFEYFSFPVPSYDSFLGITSVGLAYPYIYELLSPTLNVQRNSIRGKTFK